MKEICKECGIEVTNKELLPIICKHNKICHYYCVIYPEDVIVITKNKI
jgi:hypothetical protein